MEVFENAEGDDDADGTDDAMHHVVFECLFGSSCFRFSWRRHAIAVLYDVSKVETTETFPLWDTSVSRFSVMFPRDNFV